MNDEIDDLFEGLWVWLPFFEEDELEEFDWGDPDDELYLDEEEDDDGDW